MLFISSFENDTYEKDNKCGIMKKPKKKKKKKLIWRDTQTIHFILICIFNVLIYSMNSMYVVIDFIDSTRLIMIV